MAQRNNENSIAGEEGAKPKSADVLPYNLPPRGLNRAQSATYIGVSVNLFDEMVRHGRMPKPKRINTRTVWDRHALDRAFDALPGGEEEVQRSIDRLNAFDAAEMDD